MGQHLMLFFSHDDLITGPSSGSNTSTSNPGLDLMKGFHLDTAVTQDKNALEMHNISRVSGGQRVPQISRQGFIFQTDTHSERHHTMAPYTPTDIEVSEAVDTIQAQATEGKLGRAKIYAKLKEVYPDWILSINRLKRILTATDAELQIPREPGAALKKQEAYKRDSTRAFFIYGPGQYNYGVTPNAHMGILISISQERLAKALKASWSSQDQYQHEVSRSSHLQTIWDYYTAAAKIAGVSKDVVARQIEAEYNIPVKLLPVPYNELPSQEIEARKAVFKREGLKLKKEMLKHPEARAAIPVDSRGEPVWDDAKNGQFVLIVVKIDKDQGLQEFGRI